MLDIDCLAQAVYYEARAESRAGQYAVARVVINRAKKGKSLCSVVYSGAFSWTHRPQKYPFGRQWTVAQEEAQKALEGPDTVDGATHFHNQTVKPYWSRTLKFVIRIGAHSFYK